MLDQFIYEDHLERRFVGLEHGVYLNYNDLRDYKWSYDTINSRISRFYRPVTSRSLPLIVAGKTEAEAIYAKNRLLELAESDVVAKLPGKIHVGEYYTNGFITGSTKGDYLINKRICNIDLTLTSDNPAWYREQKHIFVPGVANDTDIIGGVDHPYDYPYDYSMSIKGRRITCDTVTDNAFKLLIYGEAENPTILIGGHEYSINGTIRLGETLMIDSLTKTITLTTASGSRVNWFDKRGRESYIFQPIPAGQSVVGWPGTYGFDLTVIEERSEPKWT